MGNTLTNVHFYNGVDYILPEVFGSAVEYSCDKYTVSRQQMDYLMEHILGMLSTTKCYIDRVDKLNATIGVFRKVIAKIEFESNAEQSGDNEERLKEAQDRIERLESNLGAANQHHKEDLEELAKYRKEVGLLDSEGHIRKSDMDKFVKRIISDMSEEELENIFRDINRHGLLFDNIYLMQVMIDKLKREKGYVGSLSEAEVNLLNILRNSGACTIIINKQEDRDVWDANKLKNA